MGVSQTAVSQFSELVIQPTLDAYLEAQRQHGRASAEAAHQMRLGMLACWRMILLLAKARGEQVETTFKREALVCFQLHVVRSWALAEDKVIYPNWVKSPPSADVPIDMGHCFVMSARHLIAVAAA